MIVVACLAYGAVHGGIWYWGSQHPIDLPNINTISPEARWICFAIWLSTAAICLALPKSPERRHMNAMSMDGVEQQLRLLVAFEKSKKDERQYDREREHY
jgi:hypothetical protein